MILSKKVSLNDILIGLHLCFIIWCALTISNFNPASKLISLGVIILLLLFSFHNIIVLFIMRKNNIPILFIFIIFISIFFLLRIITFYYSGYSRGLFLSGSISPDDYASSFMYIFLSSISLSIGLILSSKFRIKTHTPYKILKSFNGGKLTSFISLAVLSIIIAYMFRFNISFLENNWLSYFGKIFSVRIMIFYSMIYLLLLKYYNHNIYVKKKYWFIIYILFGVLLITAVGSRRIILDILIFNLIFALVFDKIKVSFNIKHFLISIFIIVPTCIIFYDFATFLRWHRYDDLIIGGTSLNHYDLFIKYIDYGLLNSEGIAKQFDRIGYLDFSIETIVYSNTYEPILNFPYYIRSIIDYITPGLNIFNTALSGQVKRFIFEFGYVSDLDGLSDVKYNSNVFTIFGEFYTLFGKILSFPFYFVIGLFLNWIYQAFDYFSELFDRIFHKSILLLFFIEGLIFSFGLDWSIVKLIYFYISYVFVRKLVINKSNQHLEPA